MNTYIFLIILMGIACLILLILTGELSNIVVEQENEIESYKTLLTNQKTITKTQDELINEYSEGYLLQKKVIKSDTDLINILKNKIYELENKN